MTFSIGDAVLVLAGRGCGRWMRVVGQEEGFLLLADGRRCPVEKPKRKNPKHVAALTRADSAVAQKLVRGEPIRNSDLRKDLAIVRQEKAEKDQGGI